MPQPEIYGEVPTRFPAVLCVPFESPESLMYGNIGLVFNVGLRATQQKISNRVAGRCSVERKAARSSSPLRVLVLSFVGNQPAELEGVSSSRPRQVIGEGVTWIIVLERSEHAEWSGETGYRNRRPRAAGASRKDLRYVDVREITSKRVTGKHAGDRVTSEVISDFVEQRRRNHGAEPNYDVLGGGGGPGGAE